MEKLIADLSAYDGAIDWALARKELAYVIFRASIGLKRDSRFLEYAQACGIPFGVFHYVKAATAEEARAEARWFMACVNAAAARPTVYFADIEDECQNARTTEAVCTAFLEELRAQGCAKIGLYIAQGKYLWMGEAITLCDCMWIPRYGEDDGNVPEEKHFPVYPCDLWQYTSEGRVAWAKEGVDLNLLHGKKGLEWFTEQGAKEEVRMGYDPQKVIRVARAEVGYLEKKSNKDLDDKTANAGSNNYTKYARDMDEIPGFYNGKKQTAAWCDIFVDWCFVKAYGVDEGRALLCQPLKSCGAGCKFSRQYYKAKGRLFDKPQVGDQIFFYPANGIGGSEIAHTGLVCAVDTEYVYTIEGNTSSEAGVVDNGGCVREKKYKLGYNRIAGYGRPNYGVMGTIVPGATQPLPEEPENPPAEGALETSVVVTGGSVNLRTGNGTDFPKVSTVYKGAVLEWIATAKNGWHAVLYKKQVVWISGKYTKVREGTA